MLLAVYSELRTSQQQTTAVSRRKIPDAAWLVIILFSMAGCCMVGKQHSGKRINHFTQLVLPLMMSLSLFLVAEIDYPGEGVIRVTPDDLELITLPGLPDVSPVAHELTGLFITIIDSADRPVQCALADFSKCP